jgi:arsenical pump membrane protein
MDLRQGLAVGVLVMTITGMLVRPHRLGEGGVACVGAALMMALGLLTPTAALRTLFGNLDLLAFFAGLMLLAYGADEAGLFAWCADRAVAAARGSPRRLLVYFGLAGVLIVALFSNDVAVLVLTPAALAAAEDDGLDPMPYALTCTFIADCASAILPISNPVNLLAIERLHLNPADYVFRLTLPGLVAAGTTVMLLLWLFRADLRRTLADGPSLAPPAAPPHGAALPALVLLCLAYVVFAARGWPLGMVTLVVGAALMVTVTRQKPRPWWRAGGGISGQALALVIGLLLVVQALDATGVTDVVSRLVLRLDFGGPISGLILMAVVVALLANVMNNWPAMLLAVGIVGTGKFGSATPAAAYGAVLGAAIGPKLTLIGSLATVLWLSLVRRRGIQLSAAQYTRTALIVTPVVLAAAMGAAVLGFLR